MLLSEQVACFEYLVHDTLVLVVEEEGGFDGLDLGFEEAEGVGVSDFKANSDICRQLLVRLAQLFAAVGVRAVLPEVTLLLQLKVLAHLGLVVVVRYVEHLVLNFDW